MQFGALSQSGFSLASGKSLQISEAALAKARALFEDDSPVKTNLTSTAKDFKTPADPVTHPANKPSRQDCGQTSMIKPSQPRVTLQAALKRKHEEASQLMTTEPKARRLKYEMPTPYRISKPSTLSELNLGRSLGLNSEASRHLLAINAGNALAYKFGCTCLIDMECFCDDRFEIDWRQCVKVLEKRKKLCSEEWMKRHFRLVVWKYAGIARRIFGLGEVFSIKRVLDCLEKRYVNEVDNGRRSVLQRLTDGDEFASSHMVLCVGEVSQSEDSYAIELTDGWHSLTSEVKADDALYPAIASGKLCEGIKLRVYGAKYEDGRLKLHANGVRRARWHVKLGANSKMPFRVNLKSIKLKGGQVPSVCVRIQRIFPPVYHEEVKGQRIVSQQPRSEESRPSLLVRVQDVLGDSIPSHSTQMYVRFWKAPLGLYNDMRPSDCYVLLNLTPGSVPKHGLAVLHFNNQSFMGPSKQPKRPTQAYAQEVDLTLTLSAVNKTFRGEVKNLAGTTESEEEVIVEMHNTVYFSMNLSNLVAGSVILLEMVILERPGVYLTCDETQIKVKPRKPGK